MGSGWNLPPGCYGGVEDTDDSQEVCEHCGHEWTCHWEYELGGWFPVNDGDFCPNCGEQI